MSRKYFYVNVRLLNGRCMIYKLPRDLQYPMCLDLENKLGVIKLWKSLH